MAVNATARIGWSGAACLTLALAVAGCASSSGPAGPDLGSRLPFSGRNSSLPEAAEELENPAQVYLKYGQWQERLGRLTEARRSYKRVLGEEPQSIEAILGMARLDHFAGRSEQAEQGFLKAAQLQPRDPAVLDALGQFYAAEKRWDRAVETLRTAARMAPEDETVRYHLAVVLARSGDVEAALPHFRKTLGEAVAQYNVGYLLYEQGKLAAAEDHFRRAVQENPDLKQAQAMLEEIDTQRQGERALARRSLPASDLRQPSGPRRPRTSPRSGPPPFPVADRSPESSRPGSPARRRSRSGWRPSGEQEAGHASDPVAESDARPAKTSAPAGPPPSSMTAQQREQWRNQRVAERP